MSGQTRNCYALTIPPALCAPLVARAAERQTTCAHVLSDAVATRLRRETGRDYRAPAAKARAPRGGPTRGATIPATWVETIRRLAGPGKLRAWCMVALAEALDAPAPGKPAHGRLADVTGAKRAQAAADARAAFFAARADAGREAKAKGHRR